MMVAMMVAMLLLPAAAAAAAVAAVAATTAAAAAARTSIATVKWFTTKVEVLRSHSPSTARAPRSAASTPSVPSWTRKVPSSL